MIASCIQRQTHSGQIIFPGTLTRQPDIQEYVSQSIFFFVKRHSIHHTHTFYTLSKSPHIYCVLCQNRPKFPFSFFLPIVCSLKVMMQYAYHLFRSILFLCIRMHTHTGHTITLFCIHNKSLEEFLEHHIVECRSVERRN